MTTTPSKTALLALAAKAKDNPRALLRIAQTLRRSGHAAEALSLVDQIPPRTGRDPEFDALLREFTSTGVPKWHLSIVRDAVRNAAYDAALRRAVKPGMRVLEIGTGSAILAMMAARAGAGEVITCEMNPTVAQTARAIVARNGFSDRIRVIPKHSDALDVDADLGGRLDLLVSEIVSNDLLAEHVLPAHERAVRDLLKPGAPVIPASGRIRVALADMSRKLKPAIAEVDGFDLSLIETWRSPVRTFRSDDPDLVLRSAPSDLFEFDFGSAVPSAEETRSLVLESTGGRIDGIVQWIDLAMDAVGRYENAPAPGARSCWDLRFYAFAQPVETTPGQRLRVAGQHDRRRVLVWRDGGP